MNPNPQNFVPENAIEETLRQAQLREIDFMTFLDALLQAELFLPVHAGDTDQPQPLVAVRDGHAFAAVLTSKTRFHGFPYPTEHLLSMRGAELFKWLPEGTGIVLNAGWACGLEMDAGGVKKTLLRIQSAG